MNLLTNVPTMSTLGRMENTPHTIDNYTNRIAGLGPSVVLRFFLQYTIAGVTRTRVRDIAGPGDARGIRAVEMAVADGHTIVSVQEVDASLRLGR